MEKEQINICYATTEHSVAITFEYNADKLPGIMGSVFSHCELRDNAINVSFNQGAEGKTIKSVIIEGEKRPEYYCQLVVSLIQNYLFENEISSVSLVIN